MQRELLLLGDWLQWELLSPASSFLPFLPQQTVFSNCEPNQIIPFSRCFCQVFAQQGAKQTSNNCNSLICTIDHKTQSNKTPVAYAVTLEMSSGWEQWMTEMQGGESWVGSGSQYMREERMWRMVKDILWGRERKLYGGCGLNENGPRRLPSW